jgi:tripartite-type tricarboxylate transporter receptor subunit TctC
MSPILGARAAPLRGAEVPCIGGRGSGQPVLIENRPGAGGNIGMDVVAKAAPDGYTIGFGAISTNALNPHLYKRMAFDPRKDFTAIGMLGYSTIVLEVGAQLPVHNVREFITYARRNPGVQFGTAGTGTSMHLAGTMFAQMANVHLVHVPYKGSAPGITDLIAGHLPAMFDNLPASLPHIQSGKLKALAVAGRQRSPSLPDVPTMAEAGLAGYEVDPWFGVYGPAGMDPRVVHALNEALVEALNLPAIRDKLEKAGFTPQSSTPQALEKLTQSEYVRLGKVANAAQMTAD